MTDKEKRQQELLRELHKVLGELSAELPGHKTYTVLVDAPSSSTLPVVIRLQDS